MDAAERHGNDATGILPALRDLSPATTKLDRRS